MAGKTVIKPYKLKPSGDTLTRDDLSTWRQILLGHIRQNNDWHQFLPSSATHKTWVCTDEDETNGLQGADANATNKLRADFQNFLTCIATYAPAGFNDTIVRESTSFTWIIDLIKTTFGLETKGENFLAIEAIYEPTTQDLLTDETKILEATLRYNVGVLTKNTVQPQDLKEVKNKQDLHDSIMIGEDKRFTEPLKDKTYRDVLQGDRY